MQTKASYNYGESLRTCALQLMGQGGFTARELAEKCGFRLTRHLRKHLRDLVCQGLMQATEAYTDGGRLATYYHKPVPSSVAKQESLPLWMETQNA